MSVSCQRRVEGEQESSYLERWNFFFFRDFQRPEPHGHPDLPVCPPSKEKHRSNLELAQCVRVEVNPSRVQLPTKSIHRRRFLRVVGLPATACTCSIDTRRCFYVEKPADSQRVSRGRLHRPVRHECTCRDVRGGHAPAPTQRKRLCRVLRAAGLNYRTCSSLSLDFRF